MLHITLNDKILNAHRKYFESAVKPRIECPNQYIQRVYSSVQHAGGTVPLILIAYLTIYEMCQYLNAHWMDIAIGDVPTLRRLRKEWDCKFQPLQIHKDFINKVLLELFGYNNFSAINLGIKDWEKVRSFNESARWSPYTFVFWSGVRVCPYCNRQYITPVITKKRKRMRADLDHFWPKSKYPIFSMSIYNLVPSCKFCNSSLKHEADPGIDAPHPYYEDYDQYFSFSITDKDSDNPKIIIDRFDNEIKPLLDMFSIEDQYKFHGNVAKDFLIKTQLYQPKFIEALLQNSTYHDAYKLLPIIVGYPINREKITEDALGKLKRDLAIHLHFLPFDD